MSAPSQGAHKGVLRAYGKRLPLTKKTPLLTLGEGDTPLVRSHNLERALNIGALYFKLEGCNPTGSFKDRGMVMAVAKALEEGSKAIICASTGNTSASAAAYAARAGIQCAVAVPKGNIALGKMAQGLAYGAKVITVEGNFDQALRIVREVSAKRPITLVNSVNPYRIEGQKTAAFEVTDALGEAPDYLCIPVGNAGNITAYWKGFKEYHADKKAKKRPKMMGFQAEGAAPIVRGHPVEVPTTIATAIRIGNPASWKSALAARDESGGAIDMVSDAEIIEAYGQLARKEGLFCEPASAASLAGLMKLRRQGLDLSKRTVVCVLTGHGLKDPDTATKSVKAEIVSIKPDLPALEEVLGFR
jgi:threonine synthase